jgi:hypothetical protein
MDTPTSPEQTPAVPNSVHRNASWGAIIAIVIILAMIVIGAFYAWGQRIDEERVTTLPATTATTTY